VSGNRANGICFVAEVAGVMLFALLFVICMQTERDRLGCGGGAAGTESGRQEISEICRVSFSIYPFLPVDL
jgi:hypothetical protein